MYFRLHTKKKSVFIKSGGYKIEHKVRKYQ